MTEYEDIKEYDKIDYYKPLHVDIVNTNNGTRIPCFCIGRMKKWKGKTYRQNMLFNRDQAIKLMWTIKQYIEETELI